MKRFALIAAVAVLSVPTAANAHVSPLRWASARADALNVARTLPVPGSGVQSVKVSACFQDGAYQINCVAEALGTFTTNTPDPCATFDVNGDCVAGTYTNTDQSQCSVTVDVRKSKTTGRIAARKESDLDCLD